MPSAKNLSQLTQLIQQLQSAQAAYLVEYQGLTTKDLTDLRAQIKEAHGKLLIAKNTLLGRAVRQLPSHNPISIKNFSVNFTGATATILAHQDQLEPLKVVTKFAKAHERPTIKYGLLNHQLLNADQVDRLAKLPGKSQLHAQVVGMLQSPLNRLVLTLNGNLQKLAIVLNQIKQKKDLH